MRLHEIAFTIFALLLSVLLMMLVIVSWPEPSVPVAIDLQLPTLKL